MAYQNRNRTTNRNRLSDRDMLADLLVTSKYMSHVYDHGIMEASSGNIRNTFENLQHDEHQTGEMLFNLMQDQGWYTTGANRQQMGQRFGKQHRKNMNYEQADSRYATTGGANNFGNRMSGGQMNEGGQSGRNFRNQPRQGVLSGRGAWNQ